MYLHWRQCMLALVKISMVYYRLSFLLHYNMSIVCMTENSVTLHACVLFCVEHVIAYTASYCMAGQIHEVVYLYEYRIIICCLTARVAL